MKRAPNDKGTPERKAAVIEALEEGATMAMAANAVGVCRSTLYNWCQRDDQFDEQVRNVWRAQNAEMLGAIRQGYMTGKDWRAAAWLVERREKSMQLKYEEAPVKSDPLADLDLDNLTEDELVTLIRLLKRARSRSTGEEG